MQMPHQVDPGEVCKDCNNLFTAFEEVWNIVDNHSGDQKLKYDIKIATEAIFKYINHLQTSQVSCIWWVTPAFDPNLQHTRQHRYFLMHSSDSPALKQILVRFFS